MDICENCLSRWANLRSPHGKPQLRGSCDRNGTVALRKGCLWKALWTTRRLWKVRGEMKAFYGGALPVSEPVPLWEAGADSSLYIGTRARVAVYDAPASAPYVEEIGPASPRDYIESLAARVFELARQRGGPIPYTVIREITENLIHAGFAEPIISVMDEGHTVRFSDQGPGIFDKERALQPGFTTATSPMKQVIRGVGSGLPIVHDFLSVSGGRLSIEDNLDKGAVVTISCGSTERHVSQDRMVTPGPVRAGTPFPLQTETLDLVHAPPEGSKALRLTTRQKQVLALVLESGAAGPSLVSRELGVGLSTAYRDLASLEELGLIVADGGKRALTEEGLSYLGGITSSPS